MRKNYCFIHTPLIGNYEFVWKEMFNKIIKSGLYEKLDKIFVFLISSDNKLKENFKNDFLINFEKIECVDLGQDSSNTSRGDGEYPSLTKLQQFAKNNDFCNLLFLTNVGVSHYNGEYQETARSWRELISYFIIENYQNCLESLNADFDIAGAEWMQRPLPHFSGTMWWAKSEYINTLVDVNECINMKIPELNSPRHGAEMWIGTNKNVKVKSFFVSGYDWNTRPKRSNWLDYVKNNDFLK